MPEAAGAVAAAAVADRLHGSKEDRKLAIVLVNYDHQIPSQDKYLTVALLLHSTYHFLL
jgi:6-phosphofructo-2-kinase / fructose-2,6-biphosphatase 3